MNPPKFLKWEFWPAWILYLPIAAYLFFVGLMRGCLSYFLSANPGLEFGGLVEYSKSAMLRDIPRKYLPASQYFPRVPGLVEVEEAMQNLGLSYPVVLKPDMGERGRGVQRIGSRAELEGYLRSAGRALILQANIVHDLECGVLVIKDPLSGALEIGSVVIKEPLSVRGDGFSTLATLIRRGERTRYHRRILHGLHRCELDEILPRGEERILMDIGNHARGSTFRNGNSHIGPALCSAFAPLMDYLPNFYLGRFDVKARNFRALEAGEFIILEINGVNSEPAHIYELGIFSAWAALLAHWCSVSKISWTNIKRGARPESLAQLIRALWQHYH